MILDAIYSTQPFLYHSLKIKRINGDGNDLVFDTGDFVKDWFLAVKHLIMNDFDHVMQSSSIDHIIF
jgi:hypothetical protein